MRTRSREVIDSSHAPIVCMWGGEEVWVMVGDTGERRWEESVVAPRGIARASGMRRRNPAA